jgi:SAM-dependent methyltransferase
VTEPPDSGHWAEVAADWIAWARAPGHDAFWCYRETFGDFVGSGPGEAVDVGCGEGRVARLLGGRGWRVTAVDPVPAFVEAARAEGSASDYAVAPAAALPFAAGTFDLAVAYNMLMDVEDVSAAACGMARVLKPGGALAASIVHPFVHRGRFQGEPFVVEASYFGRERFEGVEERDGLRMPFAGWSQPLSAYAAALAGAGLAITAIVEPLPDLAVGGERMRPWTRLPLFLWLKARAA